MERAIINPIVGKAYLDNQGNEWICICRNGESIPVNYENCRVQVGRVLGRITRYPFILADIKRKILESCRNDGEVDSDGIYLVKEINAPIFKKFVVYHKSIQGWPIILCVDSNDEACLYDRENDNRGMLGFRLESDSYTELKISFQDYLKINKFKNIVETKEQKLGKIRTQLLTSFGCQKDVLRPVLGNFIGLLKEIESLNNDESFKKNVGVNGCDKILHVLGKVLLENSGPNDQIDSIIQTVYANLKEYTKIQFEKE